MVSMKPSQLIHLDAQAWLQFWQPLLADKADSLRDVLHRQLPWQQPEVVLYGKRHRLPRLQCWMGDAHAGYRYSGLQLAPEPWHPLVLALRDQIAFVSGHRFNSVLINLYRDGNDRMGWHADDEPELGPTPWIASYNLGASRDFVLRRKGSSRQGHSVALQHDQLMLMNPAVQHGWQHALPVRRRVQQARINMTFREIVTTDQVAN